jgi:hypothetical protein
MTWQEDTAACPAAFRLFIFSQREPNGCLCHLLFIWKRCGLILTEKHSHMIKIVKSSTNTLSLFHSHARLIIFSLPLLFAFIINRAFEYTFRTSIDTFLQLNYLIFLLSRYLSFAATLHNAYNYIVYRTRGLCEINIQSAKANSNQVQ